MPKRNWLLSLFALTGFWTLMNPVMGQALLPYTPQLNLEQLEQRGLELAEDAVQLVRFQQYELALSRAKLATQLAPTQYQPWFILGTLYIQKQELDQAIEALQKALSIAPEEAGIKFTLGNAYFQQGKYRAAVRELEEGLILKPDTPAALFDLGNSYLKLKKITDAITVY
ncbi:MAG: tetratricopeptide repeat protein, partial [cyanobacterium endosymbiont of Rhopalodia inflata]